MHLEQAADLYFVQLQADGRAASTIEQYRRHLRLLGDWLAQERLPTDVARITHEHLARFLVAPAGRCRTDGQVRKATAANVLRSKLRTFFAYLQDAGYVDRSPARLIRRARCAPPPPKALSPEDERNLRTTLHAARGETAMRDRMLVALMLGAGMRLGATLALAIEDLDLTRGEAHVRRDKGNRSEIVFLPPSVVAVLRKGLQGRTRGPVFPSAHGILTARQGRCRIVEWGRRAGLRRRLSPHQLRHTMAARLYERTGDLLLVQAALRHRSLQSSTVYASCTTARLRQALAASD